MIKPNELHPVIFLVHVIGVLLSITLLDSFLFSGLSILSASVFLFLEEKLKRKEVLFLLLIALLISVMNPLFNPRGDVVLFRLFTRPYTLESLLLGLKQALYFLAVLVWCQVLSHEMNGEKTRFTLGTLSPSLAMIFTMVLRMIPGFKREALLILEARQGIRRKTDSKEELLQELLTLLSKALEDGLTLSASMESRAYGSGGRSLFLTYTFNRPSLLLLVFNLLFISILMTPLKEEGGVRVLMELFLFYLPIKKCGEMLAWHYYNWKM